MIFFQQNQKPLLMNSLIAESHAMGKRRAPVGRQITAEKGT